MEKSDTRPEAGDSDAAQAEPAGAQAVRTGQVSDQDVRTLHAWESVMSPMGRNVGERFSVPGGWLYQLRDPDDSDVYYDPVFVPEPRQ